MQISLKRRALIIICIRPKYFIVELDNNSITSIGILHLSKAK